MTLAADCDTNILPTLAGPIKDNFLINCDSYNKVQIWEILVSLITILNALIGTPDFPIKHFKTDTDTDI